VNRLNAFVASTAVLALSVAFLAMEWGEFVSLPPSSLSGLGVMLLLGVIAQKLSFSMVVGESGNSTNSVGYLPLLTTVLLFGPAAAVVYNAVAHAVGDFVLHRKPFIKGAFNVSQHVLAAGLGGIAFYELGGVPAAADGLRVLPDTVISWWPLLVFGFICIAVNHLLVSRVISLATGASFPVVWRQLAGRGGANLVYDLLVSPVAAAIALMGLHFGVGGLAMASLPLLAIRNAYLGQYDLQKANQDLLSALVKAIETRDPYTSGHSVRVAHLAKLTAEAMGLSYQATAEIEQSALVHDVGKIDAVYTEILRKPDQLTDDERETIESHVTKGVELLETMSSVSKTVISNVLHHHERWDGRGYPMQLAGQDIPLGARVITVCDSVDAMLSDRPYRKALDVTTVREELARYSGIQFDPAVVRAILSSNVLEEHAASGDRSVVSAAPEGRAPTTGNRLRIRA